MTDPLLALRAYRDLAPWSLRDLAHVTGAILDGSGIRPVNAAAAIKPNERTIRFYVTRKVVAPPDGRGTAATYSYRHLLQVLAVKLRQMEGATLTAITAELPQMTGDVLERRVAAALGAGLLTPDQLPVEADRPQARGRAGKALHVRLLSASRLGEGSPAESDPMEPTTCHRLPVAPGIVLEISADHPLARQAGRFRELAHAVRLALGPALSRESEGRG
ncbi:MAG TPA: MerR family transcriptional regulator [Gemmatimonadales bacterium]